MRREFEELKKFAKTAFDVDTILTTASDLKYTHAIQQRLAEWIANPSEDFVRLVSSDLFGSKRFTPAIKDQFTAITKRAFEQLIGEKINQRLKGAMTSDLTPVVAPAASSPSPITAQAEPVEPEIITTPEEIEAFYAIRAILRDVVPSKRVTMRDAQSYCAILLDDNNRRPICRLRFNNIQNLRAGFFNEQKEEEIVSLQSIDDIFNFADRLKTTALLYGDGK